ncbi:MAG TPA: dethiobiotin synthase [Chitinophagales bacterium]|nr:dethiobiotin synthase [Chitinophagales bacterium]
MSKQQTFFITGIGTDIGKTVAAAILVEALNADYWKPVQAGGLNDTDTDFVRRMISNQVSVIHPETFRLTAPMSPHAAAKIDGVKIRLKDFHLPKTKNTLIIEGAGGILVPLNEKRLVIDLIKKLNADVIIVIKNYLGSINHSLLTIEAAKSRNLNIAGLIINGEPNKSSEEIILKHSKLKVLGRVFPEKEITKAIISKYAVGFNF